MAESKRLHDWNRTAIQTIYTTNVHIPKRRRALKMRDCVPSDLEVHFRRKGGSVSPQALHALKPLFGKHTVVKRSEVRFADGS